MTHTPTLPNGFSRDFSEAPSDRQIIVYVKLGIRPPVPFIGVYRDGEFETLAAYFGRSECLCWGPIPNPQGIGAREVIAEQRYDLSFNGDRMTVEPHFCRDWDESGGCYGTNPDHGYSFDEACDKVAEWYEQQAKLWRDRTHHEAGYYQA